MLAFSTDEIVKRFRQQVADKLPDSGLDVDALWDEDEAYSYLTEAADRLAKDTEELSEIITRPVTAGQQFVQLPRKIHRIRQARLVTKNWYLRPFNINETAAIGFNDYGDYHIGASNVFTTTGDPRYYFLDYRTNAMMLGPIPGSAFPDDTVEMLAIVTIATPMQKGMMLQFTDTGDQQLLITYMKHRAYDKQDADALDLQRSKDFLDRYEKMVSDRAYEIKRRRQEAPIIQMDGGGLGFSGPWTGAW